jgi:hypothetical protein
MGRRRPQSEPGRAIITSDERRYALREALDDLHPCRPLDQLDFIAVRRIDEDEPAPGGTCRRAIGNRDALRSERRDRLIEAFNLKRKVDEILLNLDRAAGRETGQFDQLVTIGNSQEREVRPARRSLSLNHLKTQHRRIKPNGLIQVADPHACMEQLSDLERSH